MTTRVIDGAEYNVSVTLLEYINDVSHIRQSDESCRILCILDEVVPNSSNIRVTKYEYWSYDPKTHNINTVKYDYTPDHALQYEFSVCGRYITAAPTTIARYMSNSYGSADHRYEIPPKIVKVPYQTSLSLTDFHAFRIGHWYQYVAILLISKDAPFAVEPVWMTDRVIHYTCRDRRGKHVAGGKSHTTSKVVTDGYANPGWRLVRSGGGWWWRIHPTPLDLSRIPFTAGDVSNIAPSAEAPSAEKPATNVNLPDTSPDSAETSTTADIVVTMETNTSPVPPNVVETPKPKKKRAPRVVAAPPPRPSFIEVISNIYSFALSELGKLT